MSALSFHSSLRDVLSTAFALSSVGAFGTVVASLVVPCADAGVEVPASFFAFTSKLYVVPAFSPQVMSISVSFAFAVQTGFPSL